MQITREITATIGSKEIVGILIDVLYDESKRSTGKDVTMYHVLGNLAGRPDVEAVELANRKADKHGFPRVKVAEFRCWLPKILSRAFADILDKTNNQV